MEELGLREAGAGQVGTHHLQWESRSACPVYFLDICSLVGTQPTLPLSSLAVLHLGVWWLFTLFFCWHVLTAFQGSSPRKAGSMG